MLGSAAIDLFRQSSQSLVDRIEYVELAPLTAIECDDDAGFVPLWLRGGFPDSLLAASERDSFAIRLNFIRTCIERYVPMFGPRIPAETLDDLLGHPVAGPSWEGVVIESLLAVAPISTRASFCRTSAGADIDLILEMGACHHNSDSLCVLRY